MSENKVVYSKWIKKGVNIYIPTDNSKIIPEIEPGYYELRVAQGIGFYMFKKNVYLDELLEFPSSIHHSVLDSIKKFWTMRDNFKRYGFAFKRGILLHGKPGSGKTGIISLCTKYVVQELNGVVLSLQNGDDLQMYATYIPEIFRTIEKERPLVIIFEDIENMCNGGNLETMLLNVLDGLDQLENVVYLATTNYIEKLQERIINRPSRFDRRIYVPFLSYEDRLFYFKHKLKPEDQKKVDIRRWASDTEGLSVAHLAELIKSVIVFENDYKDTIKILHEMNTFKSLHSSKYEQDVSRSIGYMKSSSTSSVKQTEGQINEAPNDGDWQPIPSEAEELREATTGP